MKNKEGATRISTGPGCWGFPGGGGMHKPPSAGTACGVPSPGKRRFLPFPRVFIPWETSFFAFSQGSPPLGNPVFCLFPGSSTPGKHRFWPFPRISCPWETLFFALTQGAPSAGRYIPCVLDTNVGFAVPFPVSRSAFLFFLRMTHCGSKMGHIFRKNGLD